MSICIRVFYLCEVHELIYMILTISFSFTLNFLFSFHHQKLNSINTYNKQWRPQAIVFELVTNKKFDMIIMLFIGLNMLTMTLDHYNQSEIFTLILDYLNMIFIAIFSTECLMKIFALRYHYFVEPWNLFDVVVVVLSILST